MHGKLRFPASWKSGPILHESPGISQKVEEGHQSAPCLCQALQGCFFWRQHVGFYFLTYSTKMNTIFSSASCRASQLVTENYTSCQSPLCWLEERESAFGGSWVTALYPGPGGALKQQGSLWQRFQECIHGVVFGFILVPEKSRHGGSRAAGQDLHLHSETTTGERTMLGAWTRATNTQGELCQGSLGSPGWAS